MWGLIVDIYVLNMVYLVWIDFFDIEVDFLCYFDVESQWSVENIWVVMILFVIDFIVLFVKLVQLKGGL